MAIQKIIRLLFYADKWNIGFTKQSVSDLIRNRKLNEITWLKEDDSDLSADPFVTVMDDNIYIYYEFLKFLEGPGKIYRISNFNFTTRKQVTGFTPSSIHFSYPYIFTDDNNVYVIPETADAKEVALYEIQVEDTAMFRKRRVLLSGAAFLDSSLIKFNGKYWLFTCKKYKPGQLFIYYAASLQAAFYPHALNPIPCDQRLTRSAGQLFFDERILYRPTQDSTGEYGKSILISRINELTEETFNSKIVMEITPDKHYMDGTHTISFAGGLIVVDGKRKVFSLFIAFRKLVPKVKSFLARLQLKYTAPPAD